MSPRNCVERRRLLSIVLVCLLPAVTGLAHATPNRHLSASTAPGRGGTPISKLSPYESDVLARVLEQRRLAVDPQPEGKTVASIVVVPLDMIEREDPLPRWVNFIHTTSRASVIEREVLLLPHKAYDQRVIDESARNLRTLRQLSLVLILPVKAEEPGQVNLLVITKDVWSLRPNFAFSIRNGTIETLTIQPSEENVAGTHLRLGGTYSYDLSTNTFGAIASHQRLWGSRIRTSIGVNAIQFRDTGHIEGSSGTFLFGQPLYSTRTEWAWGTSLAWLNRMARPMLSNTSGAYAPRLYRDPSVPGAAPIPYRYHVRSWSWQTAVTRSYGTSHKFNISVGLEALARTFDADDLIAQGYSPETVRHFERDALERKNTRIGPFAAFDSYRNEYITLLDVETLGLQEDVQLGPRALVKVFTGSRHAQSTRDVVGVTAGLQYTFSAKRSLARLWAMHSAELSPRSQDRDGEVQAGLRLVSPRLAIGRFVYDGGGIYHYQDSRNRHFSLGGDTRLRGYPSQQFLGRHLVTSNLEFRSSPVKILEVLFGLAGFYDVGDAFDTPDRLHPKHSLGIGARATAPQLQRAVGRLDVAFPLTTPIAGAGESWSHVAVYLTLEQAFPIPVIQSTGTTTPLQEP
ncbi:MAG TPA: hypothetical protein VIV60_28510 [Polyangiaceae bacterium]